MKTSGKHSIATLFSAFLFIPLVVSAAGNQDDAATSHLSKRSVPVSVINTEKNAVPVKVVNERRESVTHLNVPVGEIVNLESNCIPADNSLEHKFWYDGPRPAPSFAIPEGYSFVVTDIIGHPSCGRSGTPTDLYLALVEDQHADRSYTIRFRGDGGQHYAFTGGLVFTAGNEPRPRNTAFSASNIVIQVVGYFVKGDGLGTGQPRF